MENQNVIQQTNIDNSTRRGQYDGPSQNQRINNIFIFIVL